MIVLMVICHKVVTGPPKQNKLDVFHSCAIVPKQNRDSLTMMQKQAISAAPTAVLGPTGQATWVAKCPGMLLRRRAG